MGGSSGGKAGSTTTTSELTLPPGLEQGANEVLAAGMKAAALPYSPNRGITVAAFNPMQLSAMGASNTAMGALGMGTAEMTPLTPTVDPNTGITGYSTGSLYDSILEASMSKEEQDRRQGLLDNYDRAGDRIYHAAGIDPMSRTSNRDDTVYGNQGGNNTHPNEDDWHDGAEREREDEDWRDAQATGSMGEYDSWSDHWDGGGPGQSGDSFEGGGIVSDVANAATGRDRS